MDGRTTTVADVVDVVVFEAEELRQVGFSSLAGRTPMIDNDHVDILLIEDSPTAARMAEFWLNEGLSTPFALQMASSLELAREIIESRPVDVIVSDLNLPDSRGLETFRAVNLLVRDTPIVVMSTESDEQLAITAVREGAQDYIVKESFDRNPLARPVRFAIERVRRRRVEKALHHSEHQLFVASVVQQQLYPEAAPRIDEFDIAGRCLPAETVAGDYYDYFPIVGGALGLVIGDVAGHGIGPALLMVETRAVLRTLALTYGDPGYILKQANMILAEDISDHGFVSLFLAVMHPSKRLFRFASAGHPSFLLENEGKSIRRLESDDPPLGILPAYDYSTSTPVGLPPGSQLLMYTDGITESSEDVGDTMFGVDRMLAVTREHQAAPATDILEAIFSAVGAFVGEHPQHDDNTVVVVKSR